ncbi:MULTISPECIES: prolyl oligopeptidase family serine peptidase [Sporosarcina]|uniref:prolyl oligopeptidase family serine peptidase n=1 Tax=Sporosarcina TaxID=1569 RepID=UPI000590262C|nr:MULTISPECIES: prolyl oligopeptidase family serine peptidase [Sporosarcina]WJY26059.1 prolyl oligopeptidase family serine peptidase [Sporosarcina sp. 0.2-SM1T-5]
MKIREEQWGTVPLLHIVDEQTESPEMPVVIFFHGFTSAKEHNLHYAFNLAKKGIRVLLPEAALHGVRSEDLDEVQLSLRFWEIILTSIEEAGFLHSELERKGLLASGRIAFAGTSMGGITTLGCLTAYPWIRTAAVMMGTPGYVKLAQGQMQQFEDQGYKLPMNDREIRSLLDTLRTFDMTEHPEKLGERPVFFWHGKKDMTVPFAPTQQFYEAAKGAYSNHPEDFVFMADNHAGHAVSRPGMLAAVDFLADHLNG